MFIIKNYVVKEKKMLKKIAISSLLLSVPTVGTHIAFADTLVPNGSSVENLVQAEARTQVNHSTDTQQAVNNNNGNANGSTLSQPLPPTNPNSSFVLLNQNVSSEKQWTDYGLKSNQDQSTDATVTQTQNTTGNPTVVQNQQANVTKNQHQNGTNSTADQNQNVSVPGLNLTQGEVTSVQAGQEQTASSPKKEKVEQSQGTTLASNQVQKIALSSVEISIQSQGTVVSTKQKQTAEAKEQSSILQGESVGIKNAQSEKLRNVKQKQETKIKEVQTQEMMTSGSASMKQIQSVKVKTNMIDTLKGISLKGIKETSINSINLIKNSVNTIVNVVQEIIVNNKLVDVNAQHYTVEQNKPLKTQQVYDQKHAWGTLKVVNTVFVGFNKQLQSLEVKMQSFLCLDFLGNSSSSQKKHKKDCNKPTPPHHGGTTVPPVHTGGETTKGPGCGDQGGKPVTPPSTGNGGTPVTPPAGNEGTTKGSDGSQGSIPVTPVSVKTTPAKPTVTTVSETKHVTTEQEAKPTVTTKVQDVQNPASSKKVNYLPITATDNYDYLLFGSLLVVAGMVLFFTRKKYKLSKKR